LIVFGRLSAVVTLVGVASLAVAVAVSPEVARPSDPSIRPIDYVGLLIALSFASTWLSAIWHWRARMPRAARSELWGLLVRYGFGLGAIAYWFWGIQGLPEGGSAGSRGTAV
jgi:drug/metabolite transporter (DMT)-like permease